jgi:hypothetical protein
MWKSMVENENNSDVVIHMGDQIYADDIYKLYIKDGIFDKNKYLELYYLTYSEPNQQKIMSNCLFIKVVSFQNKKLICNKKLIEIHHHHHVLYNNNYLKLTE